MLHSSRSDSSLLGTNHAKKNSLLYTVLRLGLGGEGRAIKILGIEEVKAVFFFGGLGRKETQKEKFFSILFVIATFFNTGSPCGTIFCPCQTSHPPKHVSFFQIFGILKFFAHLHCFSRVQSYTIFVRIHLSPICTVLRITLARGCPFRAQCKLRQFTLTV